jgi:hypothetical protein
MIQLHIESTTKEQCQDILIFLLEESLIIEGEIRESDMVRKSETGLIEAGKKYHLTSITRAIVFEEIQKKVTDKFGVEPMIYAFPLTHMESDWAGEIRKRVKGA